MRQSILKSLFVVILVISSASAVLLARGQTEPTAPPAQVYSIGLLDSDGSALYSILFYSGPEDLDKLTLTGMIPADVAFSVVIIAPESAHLVANNPDRTSLKWEVDHVAKQTVLGPFTYRVKLTDAQKQVPANLPTQVTWTSPTAGSLSGGVVEGTLKQLGTVGKITLQPQGTVNDKGEPIPVLVGDTGIWLYAPKDAVSEPLELSFTRLEITADSLPKDAIDYWWCALVKIEASPNVKLAQPILLGLPTSQILTVGMVAGVLTRGSTDEAWKAVPNVGAMRIAGAGNLVEVMIVDEIPSYLAAGVPAKGRQQGSTGVPVSGGPSQSGGFQGSGQGGFQSGQFGGQGGGFQGGFQGSGGFQLGGFQGFQGAQIGGCPGGFQGGQFGGGQGGGFQGGAFQLGGC